MRAAESVDPQLGQPSNWCLIDQLFGLHKSPMSNPHTHIPHTLYTYICMCVCIHTYVTFVPVWMCVRVLELPTSKRHISILTLINQIDLCQQIIHEQFPKVIISRRATARLTLPWPWPKTRELWDGKRKRHVNWQDSRTVGQSRTCRQLADRDRNWDRDRDTDRIRDRNRVRVRARARDWLIDAWLSSSQAIWPANIAERSNAEIACPCSNNCAWALCTTSQAVHKTKPAAVTAQGPDTPTHTPKHTHTYT